MDPEPTALPIGKGELLREGTDVAIVAIGVTVWPAMKAAERLAQDGISAAVVNASLREAAGYRTHPQDPKNVRCLVTVEEGCKMGGFGSAVLETLSDAGLMLRTKVLGLPDWYIEQGPQDLLRERYGLTADGIYNSVKTLFGAGGWRTTPLVWRRSSAACRTVMNRAARVEYSRDR